MQFILQYSFHYRKKLRHSFRHKYFFQMKMKTNRQVVHWYNNQIDWQIRQPIKDEPNTTVAKSYEKTAPYAGRTKEPIRGRLERWTEATHLIQPRLERKSMRKVWCWKCEIIAGRKRRDDMWAISRSKINNAAIAIFVRVFSVIGDVTEQKSNEHEVLSFKWTKVNKC